MVICALKSPVREIATIEGTSIHQKPTKSITTIGERECVSTKTVFGAFAHVSSVDVSILNPVGQAHNIRSVRLYKLYGSPGFLKWFLLG